MTIIQQVMKLNIDRLHQTIVNGYCIVDNETMCILSLLSGFRKESVRLTCLHVINDERSGYANLQYLKYLKNIPVSFLP
jgi:hypothetical protein